MSRQKMSSRKRVAKNVKQKCLLQRGPSCFVAAGSQIGKMQYKVWPLRLLHCSGLVWVFSGEIPTHFSTFGRKQPRTTVWANYPFKYLHISLSGVFSITCGSLWRKAHLEETAGEIYPPPEPFSLTPQSRYACVHIILNLTLTGESFLLVEEDFFHVCGWPPHVGKSNF